MSRRNCTCNINCKLYFYLLALLSSFTKPADCCCLASEFLDTFSRTAVSSCTLTLSRASRRSTSDRSSAILAMSFGSSASDRAGLDETSCFHKTTKSLEEELQSKVAFNKRMLKCDVALQEVLKRSYINAV